ncbi:MAG: 30S ribosomal protein S13 [Elusimicrobia bacterium RIFCSPLOWO2_02_FULL_39_32]|nr:MAG: 30S ribosomal protein S13 [Elusimicrobia bacterium GWA2_38_7]OGR79034.1 MAG: 30S ribosomal protein S13 [Elusimicrobia bacterium RIFCSPHIGHO2_02_FULL_39_36]OGR92618.1 MAG: 30S ribosomal protein S13 [Elusimicrobia bacterium RIFCSPLOWO2_02_FULL_39_32]OGR99264.1 MAG: 30S ribosomal protein S13 [Elusimicrobia bacterium RIFCSPLOWO2_12_FULL_39_28]
MARIAGVEIPRHKRIDIALSYIYGVGRPLTEKILAETGVQAGVRVKDLSDADINKLNNYISQNIKVEGDLRREIQQNVRRLIEIGSYRGLRHRRNLPLRGQRTRTNARTRRGKRKTVGSARAEERKAPAPAK